jgi:spore maturation protein CgeB
VPKIAYIGAFGNLWDEEGNARSFEKLGCKVLRLEEEEINVSRVVRDIKDFDPDFVLIAKLKLPAMRDFLHKRLKDTGIPVITWTFDLFWGLDREDWIGKDPMFKSDLVLSPDGGNDKRFKEAGVNHVCLRQAIFDNFCFKGTKRDDYEYDVIFVGCENKQWFYRSELCEFLNSQYPKFRWFGRRNTLEIRGKELNDLYASAKVVVGDSVFSPYYWSNRIYETLGRGGFLIHPEIPGLNEEYEPYKHYIPYKMGDWRGLKEKIDYFIRKPLERKKIADEALQYTKINHTLTNRCQNLLKSVRSLRGPQ